MTKVSMIVAIGPNNIIGYKDKLAWTSKADLKHFKDITLNKPILMGSTTFEGLPKAPLPNRLNIVLDNNVQSFLNIYGVTSETGGYIKANSIENALAFCKHFDEVFICGGASIYKYCIEHNLIDKAYITKIYCSLEEKEYVYFPIDINEYFNYNFWDAHLENVQNEDDKLLEFWTYTKK